MDESGIQGKRQVAEGRPWGTIFGLTFIVFYISLTMVAITRFPYTVSPSDLFLSALGNADLSPDGAIFYNLGVILGGLAEILFFIAIYAHYSQFGRRWVLRIGLIAGLIFGVSVSMSGINPEYPNMVEHETWSYLIFFSMIPLLLAFSLAFLGMVGTSRWVSLYGFLVCVINVIFLVLILSDRQGSMMEWITVLLYLIWVLLVSLDVLERARARNPA